MKGGTSNISVVPEFMKKIQFHEYLMGLLLLQVIVRLAIKASFNEWFFAYIAVFAVYGLIIFYGTKSMHPLFNRIRLLCNIAIMFFAYSSIKYIIPVFFGSYTFDGMLSSLDKSIIGGDLSHTAQRIYSSPLTELMSTGYFSYYVAIAVTLLYYGFRSSIETFCKFCMGLFGIFALGIIAYTIVPAVGPYVYFKGTYDRQLTGYLMTKLNNFVVISGSCKYDVFPSLHTGVGLFILLFTFFNSRKGFYVFLIPFIFLISSTIYLRYHYFTDLFCGACLSIAVFITSKLIFEGMKKKLLIGKESSLPG
ncbi:MAG: phosphatase PAP2 family protein [Bacillota bacterium]|nr:phosphatase PAP2 family protein [Bacillota bacterium]